MNYLFNNGHICLDRRSLRQSCPTVRQTAHVGHDARQACQGNPAPVHQLKHGLHETHLLIN